MINNLDQVLRRFADAGLKLKPRKCQLFKKEFEFLGHIINESGVNTDPRKIDCIKYWREQCEGNSLFSRPLQLISTFHTRLFSCSQTTYEADREK